jgi:hypothetical protein
MQRHSGQSSHQQPQHPPTLHLQSSSSTKHPPGSVNSTESEGSNMQSGASADSQRSVYLHATTVADIPTPVVMGPKQQQRMRALSREDLSKMSPSLVRSGGSGGPSSGETLRRSRHISRSYSVLAPWKPRHYRDKFEITYSNQQQPTSSPSGGGGDVLGKPPRPPRRREDDAVAAAAAAAAVAVAEPSSSKPVSRSSTMPKNTKLAGWFRNRKKKR